MSGYEKLIDSLLIKVEKPARYTGGEYNTPDMTKQCDVRVCMCFPDLYEVGMSNLGIRILYHMLNDTTGVVAERCFAPQKDFGQALQDNNIPLFSIETRKPLKDFDLIGFSVQFEMLYTNVLYMLDLAGIPFYSRERDESYPLIIGGGPCSVNPEPFAPFFDIIVIGDGEVALSKIIEMYKEHKARGYSKAEFLNEARTIKGVYVPQMTEVEDFGRFLCVAQDKIVQQDFVEDLENSYYPTDIIIPNIEAIHDRPVLELFRGCPNGCRFCQAGFFYRPIRSKKADTIVDLGIKSIDSTGYDEISLASLSSSDYHSIQEVIEKLSKLCDQRGVKLSLPSLRMDSFKGAMTINSRISSLTFAPEAGTQRLRDVINKNITDEDILCTIKGAIESGYKTLKLYFMIGLPTETLEDLDGIREIIYQIKDIYSDMRKRRPLNINLSAAVFVPKPLTPFQWEAQIDYDTIVKRQDYLKKILRIKGVKFNWHGGHSSILETVLARGDRRLAQVIECAYNLGCKFDSWSEHYNNDLWIKAFDDVGIDMNNYTNEIPIAQRLPWDFIDFYVSKRYLVKEREKSFDSQVTISCKEHCQGCFSDKMRCDK